MGRNFSNIFQSISFFKIIRLYKIVTFWILVKIIQELTLPLAGPERQKLFLLFLLVSTYLFVRCNNHKSVWHLCEEVSWLSPVLKLIYLCLRRCLIYSWLILVQVPLYPEIFIPFFFSQWYPWLLPAPTRWRNQIQIGTSFNQTFPSTKLIGTWSRPTCLTASPLLQPSSFNAKGKPLSQTFIPIGFANTLCISVHAPVFLTQLTDAQATTQSSFSKALTWSGHPGPGVAVHSSAGPTLRTKTIVTDPSANNFTALAGLTPNSLPSEAGPRASTGHIGLPSTAASPTSTARPLCTSRTTRTSNIASPTRPTCPMRTSSSIPGKKTWSHPWRTSWTHHLMSHHLQPTTTMTNESNSDESNARGAKPPADLDQPKPLQPPLRPRPLPTSCRTTPSSHRPQSMHPHGSDWAHHLDLDSPQAQTTPDPRHLSRPRQPHRLRLHHRCQPRAHRAHLPSALRAPSQWSLHLHRTPHNGHQCPQTHGTNQIQMAFRPLQPTSESQLLPTWNPPMPSRSASRNPATISSHSLSRGHTSETSPTTCPPAVNNSPHSPIGRSLYPTSERHLCPAPSELQRRRILQHNDVVGTFISTILTPPGPTGVHRTDAHDPTPHQHRRSRDCHFDQLLLHQDEPGTSFGLPDQPRQSRWDHSNLPERMAEFRRRPIPALPQPKRHICQIQLQRGLRDLRSPHCKHSGTPKGMGRQRPQHPSWPDFWTPSIPSLRRDGRKSSLRSRWIQAMSDNWLLYSWPVTNFFWHPRAKMAPRQWLQVRYDARTGNRIPFVHSHTPVLRFLVLKHFSFTTLILWMFQDRHLCNKFAMTARSHNTAQTLRH